MQSLILNLSLSLVWGNRKGLYNRSTFVINRISLGVWLGRHIR